MTRVEQFLESHGPILAFGYVFLLSLVLLLVVAKLSEFLASILI